MTDTPARDDERLLREAADWLITLTSGQATEADARALATWRERDPMHDAAFRHVARMMNLTRLLIDHPPARLDRRAVLGGAVALFTAGGAYGVARPPLGLWPSFTELAAGERTRAGERRVLAPTPGVAVEMNSRTSLSLAANGRTMDLINGQTFITVAARGFEVHVADVRLAATQAVFDVQTLGGKVDVVCVEGHVQCGRGGERLTLGPSEALSVDARGGPIRRASANAHAATAWRSGLLVFEGAPLSEVVRQINRYRSGDIVLTNAALGDRPVNAVFHTAQIDNAVSQIQQLLDLEVRRLPGGVILMS